MKLVILKVVPNDVVFLSSFLQAEVQNFAPRLTYFIAGFSCLAEMESSSSCSTQVMH